jgi:hypothetical protein
MIAPINAKDANARDGEVFGATLYLAGFNGGNGGIETIQQRF